MVVAQRWSSHKIEFRPLEVNDPFKEDETFKKFEEPEDITIEQALKLSQEEIGEFIYFFGAKKTWLWKLKLYRQKFTNRLSRLIGG